MRKRIGILTGGGDVAPLNMLIAAAKDAAELKGIELLGFKKGWEGVIRKKYYSLRKIEIDSRIGGTILKSSRVNLEKVFHGPDEIIRNIEDLNIDGLIVVGGEDTLSNVFYIRDIPQILISKTIDNDVGCMPRGRKIEEDKIINYFTLGHPTAANKISSFVSLSEGLRTTAYSHEKIIIVESMGMHAGWLALSSTMGHPDFIIIPEYPLDYDKFVEIVINRYKKQKNVIIVIAEGSKWKSGSYISANDKEKDDFGHPRFKDAAAVLAERFKVDMRNHVHSRNINAINPSYLYRSGKPCYMDTIWAKALGRTAIKLFERGIRKPTFITIQWKDNKYFVDKIELGKNTAMKQFYRLVDWRFYDYEKYYSTLQARKYFKKYLIEFPKSKYHL